MTQREVSAGWINTARPRQVLRALTTACLLTGCSSPSDTSAPDRSAANVPAAGSGIPGQPGAAGTSSTPVANPAPIMSTPTMPSDGAPDAGSADCGRQRFEVERKPADILLVLDRSGSMKNSVDDDDDDDDSGNAPSKWELVVPALQQVISATDNEVWWGLTLFPAGDGAGECSDESYPREIAVPIKAKNAQPVNAAITSARPEGDGTPTGDAVDEALKYLNTVQDGNPKYILLATDGEPSCAGKDKGSDSAREAAVSAVERAAAASVATFVVGIATTKDSANETLTALAAAGGQAPASGYYLASNQSELVDAMQRITGSVASCRFPLSSNPPDPDHVGVLIGASVVPKDTTKQNGWSYIGSGNSEIELFGAICDSVMRGDSEPVNVVFGCKNDALF